MPSLLTLSESVCSLTWRQRLCGSHTPSYSPQGAAPPEKTGRFSGVSRWWLGCVRTAVAWFWGFCLSCFEDDENSAPCTTSPNDRRTDTDAPVPAWLHRRPHLALALSSVTNAPTEPQRLLLYFRPAAPGCCRQQCLPRHCVPRLLRT